MFCGNFGLCVNTQGIDGAGFVVIASASIENKIGGEKNERDVTGQFAKLNGDIHVELSRECRIGLAVGTFAEGGTMKDSVGLFLTE